MPFEIQKPLVVISALSFLFPFFDEFLFQTKNNGALVYFRTALSEHFRKTAVNRKFSSGLSDKRTQIKVRLSIICATLDPTLSWHSNANEILMLSVYFSALVLILSKNCINFHTGIGQCAISEESSQTVHVNKRLYLCIMSYLRQCKN